MRRSWARPGSGASAGLLSLVLFAGLPGAAVADEPSGPTQVGRFDGRFVTPAEHILRVQGKVRLVDVDPLLPEPTLCQQWLDVPVVVREVPGVAWETQWSTDCGAARGEVSAVAVFDEQGRLTVRATYTVRPDHGYVLLGVPLLDVQSDTVECTPVVGAEPVLVHLRLPSVADAPRPTANLGFSLEP